MVCNLPKIKKSFTLIELLIVVAIVVILALIAVPNYLEAQTRSKTARTRADMRAIAGAIEAYYVDNNDYPIGYNLAPRFGLDLLTSPVAYITHSRI
ncbi:MAG: prepilin-type N-terminal cleavage/methylation domain-containing protein, partial [Candidatus Sumerlaeia bacterium]|nr:prepilin-type N-terminal cleavage/methylation domain-containing protein [Candidatus Sumerlaeia bacterium]